MFELCWQTDRGGKTVKRTAAQRRKTPRIPITWRDAEYSALCAIAADTCDDRVSEDIFDIEDEWAEVDIIVHRTNRRAN
jgi:hypothetical protein